MKDGMFLSEYTSEHFYKIQAVSQADAGNYNCYAKNIVGTIISESIPLVVACKSFFCRPGSLLYHFLEWQPCHFLHCTVTVYMSQKV